MLKRCWVLILIEVRGEHSLQKRRRRRIGGGGPWQMTKAPEKKKEWAAYVELGGGDPMLIFLQRNEPKKLFFSRSATRLKSFYIIHVTLSGSHNLESKERGLGGGGTLANKLLRYCGNIALIVAGKITPHPST